MADQAYRSAKAAFIEGRMENVLERKKQLYSLQESLVKELPQIEQCLRRDLERNQVDATAEVDLVVRTIRNIYKGLDFEKTLADEERLARGESYIHRRRASGIILIAPEFRNPFTLSLTPLAIAIANGCPAILCLPSQTPSSNQIISDILKRSIDQEAYHTIHEENSSTLIELCRLPFDVAEIQLLEHRPEIYSTLQQANFRCQINEIQRGVVTAVISRTANLKTAASELCQAVSRFNGTSPNAPRLLFVDESVIEEFKQLLITNLDQLQKTTSSHHLTAKPHYDGLIKQWPGSWTYPNDITSYGSSRLLVLNKTNDISPNDLENLSSGARSTDILVLLPTTSLDRAIDKINNLNQREAPEVTYAFADSKSGAYLANFINSKSFSINHIFLEDLITLESTLNTLVSVPRPIKSSPSTDFPASISSQQSLLRFTATEGPVKKIKQAAGYRLSYFEQGVLIGLGIFGLLGTIVVSGTFKLYSKITV